MQIRGNREFDSCCQMILRGNARRAKVHSTLKLMHTVYSVGLSARFVAVYPAQNLEKFANFAEKSRNRHTNVWVSRVDVSLTDSYSQMLSSPLPGNNRFPTWTLAAPAPNVRSNRNFWIQRMTQGNFAKSAINSLIQLRLFGSNRTEGSNENNDFDAWWSYHSSPLHS